MKSAFKKFSLLGAFLPGLLILLFITKTTAFGYGEARNVPASNEAISAPVCGNTVPSKPWLYSAKSLGNGVVELTWTKADNGNSWTVAYGVISGKYVYGISNFGNSESRSIKISHLPAGTYYFVVRANNGCMPGPFSNEQKVNVGSLVARLVQKVTGGQPTPTPTVKQQGTQIKPTPTVKTVRPTIVPSKGGQNLVPTATPTPTPKKGGLLQRILDFFSGK